MRIRLNTFVIAAAIAAAAAQLAAQTDFQWRGPLTTGQTLEIKDINGDIRAEPSSSGVAAGGVTICAVYPDVAGQEPNRCEPGAKSKSHTRNNDTTVRFTVQVPVGVALVARTVNGSIEGDGLNGDAEGHTVNGSVRLSTSGTASGNTVNGSLTLTMARTDWRDEAKFSTVNGSITLRLPAFLSANLHATTLNGEIESDFPITTTGTVNRRRIDGTIGNGGQRLTLSTVNGSVKLLRQ